MGEMTEVPQVEPTIEQIGEQKAWRELGLTDAEYELIIQRLGRAPNWTELGMFSGLWSEHCSYKHSRSLFHLFPTSGPQILEGPGENAGVVDIGDGLAVVFKVESHNHPSAIEPYIASATGVGGCLRDVFAMGARPVAALNSLRFGPLTDARVRELLSGVAKGMADYGNTVNVPTVGGEIYFDPSYTGNPLVNAMTVGIVEHGGLATARATGVGNPVIVLGGKTGRDGVHGASFASSELDGSSSDAGSRVAIGDPQTGARLIEATLELIASGMIVGVQDMGAAGLTSSSAEMAERAGTGIEIDVAKVPQREEGMTPFEMMLSESQERMLLVARKGTEDRVLQIGHKWNLDVAVVGQVTDDGMLRVLEGDRVAAEVPAEALSTTGAPLYHPEQREPAYLGAVRHSSLPDTVPDDLGAELLKLLASPTIASKEWVYRHFEANAQGKTVTGPGAGDAAVVQVGEGSRGLALTIACNSRYVYLNPFRGAQIAVAEAARNISCVGGQPLAITDGLNFGSPENPEIFWQLEQSIRGIREACLALGTPVTGGNVSLYNESGGKAIYPTPIIGMVGVLEDVQTTVGSGWQHEGDVIVLLGETRNELGGSEYLALQGVALGDAPDLDLQTEQAVQTLCRQLIREGWVKSAHDCSEGGLAVALSESSIQSGLGAQIDVAAEFRADALLFGESQSRIIVSIDSKDIDRVQAMADQAGVHYKVLGKVGGANLTISLGNTPGAPKAGSITLTLSQLTKAWAEAIPQLMTEA